MGLILTFYSFKGGVGRTMALANIAYLLAKMEKRVLVVDWDLEAPGLQRYFRDFRINHSGDNQGLLDLLIDACSEPKPDWRNYISSVHLSERDLALTLLNAGRQDGDYAA